MKEELVSSSDLTSARRYWSLIGGEAGYDVRSAARLIECFRIPAFQSNEGLATLISEMRRLTDECGEYPTIELFDPPLENLIRSVAGQSQHPQATNAAWLLDVVQEND